MFLNQLYDYPALKRLAASLWQAEGQHSGAAVMVGAGFSRAAATAGDESEPLPLWHNFLQLLTDNYNDGESIPLLRLAQEYQAYHGRRALLDVIEGRVRNHKWQPGELHNRLLRLKWTQILTTNWDTLLERGAMDVHHRHYQVVNRQQDLGRTCSPRIAKLHGTIGVTDDLIFTQEDYRAYPESYAAFVNFARQVAMENDLCLLGFSGDDPNFLQWVGWVRDKLAGQTRNIYLVGVLNLSPMSRRYFESINITPVDLAPLVAEYDTEQKHRQALTKLFDALEELEPARREDWMPRELVPEARQHEPGAAAAAEADWVVQQLPILKTDRESYPGWLVCPTRPRHRVSQQVSTCMVSRDALGQLASSHRAQLLYELAWRHRLLFQPVRKWLAHEMLTIADPEISCGLRKQQQFEIVQAILDSLRWLEPGDRQKLAETVYSLLRQNPKHWPEAANALCQHEALWARDGFDHAAMATAAERITTHTPVWMLRKAGLLAKLGRFTQANALLGNAHRQLAQQYDKDRQSIYLFSRLAWAHWLQYNAGLNASESRSQPFPNSYYADKRCSPWVVMDSLREQVTKAIEQQNKTLGIEPNFEPGRYKDKTQTVTLSNEIHPLLFLEGVASRVGLPLRWQNVNVFVDQAVKILHLDDLPVDDRFALAVRAANSDTDEVINRVFSRIEIARLSQADAQNWLERCLSATNYWADRVAGNKEDDNLYCISHLRVFMEVTARLVVRAEPGDAASVFRKAIELGKQPAYQHFWLHSTLNHLLKFSLASVPEKARGQLLEKALSFPLGSEVPHAERGHWPNPVINTPGERGSYTALDGRIAATIDSVASGLSNSGDALLRLLPLLDAGFLTPDEQDNLKTAIWGQITDYSMLSKAGLFSWVLLELPCDDAQAVREGLRHHLFDAFDSRMNDLNLLADVVHSSAGADMLPCEQRAVELFDCIVSWRPDDTHDPLGLIDRHVRQQSHLIAQVLSRVVIPALPASALVEDNFYKCQAFIDEVSAVEAVSALPFFGSADLSIRQHITDQLKASLQSRDPQAVLAGAQAITNWCEQGQDDVTTQLTQLFVYRVVYGGGHRSAMLAVVQNLYEKGFLLEHALDALIENLAMMFDAAEYGAISSASLEAVDAPLLRASCLVLAEKLLADERTASSEITRIAKEGRQDVLPEVRFAAETGDV